MNKSNLDNIEEEELSGIEKEPEQKPVKQKKPMTEKQLANWEKCKAKRDEKRNERKTLLEALNKKLEEEAEAKIVKKAQTIQKRKTKQAVSKILKEEVYEEEKPKKPKKQLKEESSEDEKPKKSYPSSRQAAPQNSNYSAGFVWC